MVSSDGLLRLRDFDFRENSTKAVLSRRVNVLAEDGALPLPLVTFTERSVRGV